MKEITYSFAAPEDLSPIHALLEQCALPTEGLAAALEHCLVAKSGAELAGVVALEPYRQFGLLRSLAVAPSHRRQGLGQSLCARLVNHARLQQIERLYLLTTTAASFFAARGFERVAREQVPAEVQASAQFRSLCPVTAVCLTRDLRAHVIHASADLLRLRPDVPGARMWAVSLEHTMLTYFEVAPRSRFETHSHESEQITMVLTGELFFQVGPAVHCLKPGEVIAIPASVPHAVWTEVLAVTALDAWSPVMKKYS